MIKAIAADSPIEDNGSDSYSRHTKRVKRIDTVDRNAHTNAQQKLVVLDYVPAPRSFTRRSSNLAGRLVHSIEPRTYFASSRSTRSALSDGATHPQKSDVVEMPRVMITPSLLTMIVKTNHYTACMRGQLILEQPSSNDESTTQHWDELFAKLTLLSRS